LAGGGVESYTEDLIKTLGSLLAMVGGGVSRSSPTSWYQWWVPSAVLIRDLYDHDAWVKGSNLSLGAVLTGIDGHRYLKK
jgi:hypothetical protein